MTSIWPQSTNCIDALMCARSFGLHDAPYTKVSRHFLFKPPADSNANSFIVHERLHQSLRTVNPTNTVFATGFFSPRQKYWLAVSSLLHDLLYSVRNSCRARHPVFLSPQRSSAGWIP